MKENLSGKTVIIDGIEYRLSLASDNRTDNRTKAVASMKSPFGDIIQIFDRNELRDGIEEGEYEIDGTSFSVKFTTEEEAIEISKRATSVTPFDLMVMKLMALANEDKEE